MECLVNLAFNLLYSAGSIDSVYMRTHIKDPFFKTDTA